VISKVLKISRFGRLVAVQSKRLRYRPPISHARLCKIRSFNRSIYCYLKWIRPFIFPYLISRHRKAMLPNHVNSFSEAMGCYHASTTLRADLTTNNLSLFLFRVRHGNRMRRRDVRALTALKVVLYPDVNSFLSKEFIFVCYYGGS
jgi:hypothetical protein